MMKMNVSKILVATWGENQREARLYLENNTDSFTPKLIGSKEENSGMSNSKYLFEGMATEKDFYKLSDSKNVEVFDFISNPNKRNIGVDKIIEELVSTLDDESDWIETHNVNNAILSLEVVKRHLESK
jgi:hypothetical protein